MASTSAASAAASSTHEIVEYGPLSGFERSNASPKLFDVFINHRGPDVKDTLAFLLYNSIKKIGFLPFLDSQEIELGDSIPSALEKAIHSASVHIAIFSKRYAESAWCLAELVLMLQTGVKIIPVFYGVAPSDLRYIEKGVYADAFATYKEKGRYLNKLDDWKKALHSVSLISGYESSKHNNDYDKLCEIVTSAVLKEVERKIPLHVAKHSVGLDETLEDFERHCLRRHSGKQGVQIIGIYGIGGSGKTTLAKEFFNRKRSAYDGSSFLFDVTEASNRSELPYLQIKLLKDLFREDRPKFQSTDEGTSYLRYRLGRGFFLRFLIVLDDINHMDQLDALVVTDTLNSESLVIVTTRDERVLMRAAITRRYKMKEMNQEHSRELFCWHAFRQPYPSSGYDDLVESFMKECGGLPLSLKVFGGHVSGSTDKHFWQLELNKIHGNMDIKQRLKISYDALDWEQKQIFVDIACFFIGKLKSTALRVWEGSGWNAEDALQTLKEKSLIGEVEPEMAYWEDKWLVMNTPCLALTMHDHLRDLGKELAAEQSSPRRLWCPEDLKPLEKKGFQNILTEINSHSFRCFHSFFQSSVGGRITYFLGNSDDCAETSTALLSLELYLREDQLISIPSWIPLQNLQRLRIVFGCLKRLWHNNTQAPSQLKELVLQQISLEEFPSSLGMLIQLQDLVLKGKTGQGNPMLISGKSLSEVLRKLTNLRSLILCEFRLSGELDLKNDGVSTTFDSSLSNLQTIKICAIQLAYKVSVSGKHCPNLKSLQLDSMENLIEVDLTLVNALNTLTVKFCNALKTISGEFNMAAKLAILNIQKCLQLEVLPSLETLSCLESITIDRCQNLQTIIHSEEFKRLKYLHLSAGFSAGLLKVSVIGRHNVLTLSACRELKTLSGSFHLGSFDLADLGCLERFIINRCWNLRTINGIHLEGLKSLHLSGTEVSVSNLLICGEFCPSLESLEVHLTLTDLTVRSCRRLKSISGSFNMATKLVILNIEKCPQFEELTSLSCKDLNLLNIKGTDKLKGLKVEHWPSLESLQVDLSLILNSLTIRSCRSLKSISGSFDMATKLTILEIEECPELKELPNLACLSCLERITINGCLNLKNIKGIQELEGLKYLHLSTGGVNVVSINGKYCNRLESVYLESMENLIYVYFDSVYSLKYLRLRSCSRLQSISGIFGSEKLEILEITECLQFTKLPNLERLSCLERITIHRCLNLQNIEGIDKLERLKYLHLSTGSVSEVSVNGEHCQRLESVYLESMKKLISLILRSCKSLKSISGSFCMDTKLKILEIEECPELEELPNLAGLSCLESITINGCPNLKNIKGIDNLEGLKYLHLSRGGVSEVSVNGGHCQGLESVFLESMESLVEVNLTCVKSLNSLKLRSCRSLKAISGKLKILEIEECPELEELPNLAGLSYLESITINGCPNLKNIKGIDNLEGLKYLHLSRGGVSEVSVNGGHCHGLESVFLEFMESLIEVNLTCVKSLNSLTLRSCRSLKAISGSFGMDTKLKILEIEECPELEELTTLGGQSCLERIVFDGCCKLQNLTGIEELEALKYLHLSGGYEAVQICIPRLQRLPSQITTVIGVAFYKYWSQFNSKLFTDLLGVSAVSAIHQYINLNQLSVGESQHVIRAAPLDTPRRLNAIIVCALVQSHTNFGRVRMPLPPNDLIESRVGAGQWMVTIVISGEEEIKHAQQDISTWIPRVSSGAIIEGGCILLVRKRKLRKRKESKPLNIFKLIIDNLYEKISPRG